MCDTMVTEKNGSSVFGKNSDRDPGELQILQYSTDGKEELLKDPCPEKLSKYLDGPYRNLRAYAERWPGKIPAFISRPAWIWGAEMGVNAHGLAIGNEAVFSREKATPGGLLGMDILRLALHNCASAEEALGFLSGVIEEIGQGGNGSYKGTLKYHNSFLVKDPKEAFLLETSGHNWVSRRITRYASISNAYSISDTFDASDEETRTGFKGRGENKLFTFFARGRSRQAFTSRCLAESAATPTALRKILRSHMTRNGEMKKNMDSICVHSRGIVSSETTSSMIVAYSGKGFVIWVTGSPYPCVSLYKPLVFDGLGGTLFTDPKAALFYAQEAARISRRFLAADRITRERVLRTAEEYEDRFEEMIRPGSDLKSACAAAWELEKEFREKIAL